MYSYLNISMSGQIIPDEIKGREIHHSFPMTLFVPQTTHLDHSTLTQLKHWTWQFCIIRPVCSFLMISLQLLGVYPPWLSWIFTVVLNVSVYLALYSLVKFFHVFAKELEPHKPLTKFMCIQGIVFFCFWQVYIHSLISIDLGSSHCCCSSFDLEKPYMCVGAGSSAGGIGGVGVDKVASLLVGGGAAWGSSAKRACGS